MSLDMCMKTMIPVKLRRGHQIAGYIKGRFPGSYPGGCRFESGPRYQIIIIFSDAYSNIFKKLLWELFINVSGYTAA